nr:reverse transcriptase domain-containing protein [Tanacetum cinerariifolium]
NQSSTSGTLLSNTIPNPKGEMKAITTQSGVAYEEPSIPTPKKVVEQDTEETTDKEQTNFQGSSAHIQPLVTPILELDVLKTLPKHNIPYPSRLNDQKLREKATNQLEKMDVCHALADLGTSINLMALSIWKMLSLPEVTPTWMTLELADRSITRPKGVIEDVFIKVGKFHFPTDFVVVDFEADPRVPLILGRSFLRTVRALIDVYGEEITLQEYAQEIIGFSNNSSSGNPTSTSEPILSDSSPSLTPFEGSDFILEEIKAYLKDESFLLKIDHADCDPEGDICLIEKLLNDDPFQLPLIDLKQGEVVNAKSSIKEPSKLELKDLPSHLEYAYLEGVDKLPVIIAKDLKVDEKEALLKCLNLIKGQLLGKSLTLRIARPITHLLEKEKPFVFSKDCIDAFKTLKKKLTEAPILVVPDWNLPFELMCDASDFAIGAVLGQRKTKHF